MFSSSTSFIRWSIYWVILILSFSIVGFILVSTAMGYRYNPQAKRFQKTGMLILTTEPKDSFLVLGTKEFRIPKTTRLPNILPGIYHAKVTYPNYQDWESTLQVKPGFVTNLETITLFLAKPKILPVTADHELSMINAVEDRRIRIYDSELWYGSELISRFSQPILGASLLPTKRHVVYAIDKEIRLIDIYGQNDHFLHMRTTANATRFAFDGESIVIFKDGSLTTVLQYH